MQIENEQLVKDLLRLTDNVTERVQQLKKLDATLLNHKETAEKWSVLECIEHLNMYGDFYLPEIERRILAQKPVAKPPAFKSGVLGNYFANMMRADGKKMKTMKDKNPANSTLTMTTIDRFLKQQDRLGHLLTQAQNIDLTRTRTAISISSFIKLRLGDTFRFLIYHIDRHVQQAERAAGIRK
ncbi:DinB family protein [Nemorincola caseinilytica]|uniref:DinB family protein n=1 Tax=Nemorincola caseinilytica TaxID=2054315 RepID=A0ABP8NM11_9BACT